MQTEQLDALLAALQQPFHPQKISWKPRSVSKDGTRALALAYADLRVYQNRLDEVCGLEWAVTYTPWGERVICHLTINGITRSSTGEADSPAENAAASGLPVGTTAEAQAFKRACSTFGLGRYLYAMPAVWVDYDARTRSFTAQAQAKLKEIVVQHYRRVSADDPAGDAADELLVQLWQQFEEMGRALYGDRWTEVSRHNVERVTEGATDDPEELTAAQLETLIAGMEQVKRNRESGSSAKQSANVAA